MKNDHRQLLVDSIFCQIAQQIPSNAFVPDTIRGILDGIDCFVEHFVTTEEVDIDESKLPSVAALPGNSASSKQRLIARILQQRPKNTHLPYFKEMEYQDIVSWAEEYAPDAL